jgi:hypothetical protein
MAERNESLQGGCRKASIGEAPHRDRDRWTILEGAKELAVACRDGTQSHSSVACSRPHAHSVVCVINFNFVHDRREGDHERRHGRW